MKKGKYKCVALQNPAVVYIAQIVFDRCSLLGLFNQRKTDIISLQSTEEH